jgi:hypothetical protein
MLADARKNLFLMADRQAAIHGPGLKISGLAMKTIFGTPGKDARHRRVSLVETWRRNVMWFHRRPVPGCLRKLQ